MIRFGRVELRDLIVGTLLVIACGVSFFMASSPFIVDINGLILSTVFFSAGFLLHELAHKCVAQRFGLWAEFRLNITGIMLTTFSIISPLKFIAPGAVVISGFADRNNVGRTAVAGPIVNVVIAIILLALMPVFGSTSIALAILAGSATNAFLALFNLVPLAVLDGRKVYVWNRGYWAGLFSASLALTAYTNFILSLSRS